MDNVFIIFEAFLDMIWSNYRIKNNHGYKAFLVLKVYHYFKDKCYL